jgi:hypothetical protein
VFAQGLGGPLIVPGVAGGLPEPIVTSIRVLGLSQDDDPHEVQYVVVAET